MPVPVGGVRVGYRVQCLIFSFCFLRLSVAFVLLALLLKSCCSFRRRARPRKKRPGKILQAGGGETFFNDQNDRKHCKYQCVLLLEASKVPQNHAICAVFCGLTPGNHVNIDGFGLSSPHVYEVFSKNTIFAAFRAPHPQKRRYLRSFCNAATCSF